MKNSLALRHNRQEGRGGAEYLVITEKIVVLPSAPYPPHESFFHQGQNHTILISSGAYLEAYAPYVPLLDTQRERESANCFVENGMKGSERERLRDKGKEKKNGKRFRG